MRRAIIGNTRSDAEASPRMAGVVGERPRYPYSLMSTSEISIKRNVETHVRYRDFRYRLERAAAELLTKSLN